MIKTIQTTIALAVAALAFGSANAATVITTSAQGSVFTVSNTDLLQTNLASTSSVGVFSREGEAGLSALNNGSFGPLGSVVTGNVALDAATADGTNSVTYTLGGAFNLTSISTYAGWDQYRGGQSYTVSYAQAGAPGTFISLGSVFNDSTAFANTNTMAQFVADSGFLATNVVAVKFDFGGNLTYGYAGYREIDVAGSAVSATVPEPGVWALMVVGFGLVGFNMRRRSAAVAA